MGHADLQQILQVVGCGAVTNDDAWDENNRGRLKKINLELGTRPKPEMAVKEFVCLRFGIEKLTSYLGTPRRSRFPF